MPVAGFLNPLQPLAPPMQMAAAAAAAAADGGGAAPSSGSLQGFTVSHQLQPEWCWAAVSSSIANFYGPTQWTQCGVASSFLKIDCCGGDASGPCNQPEPLDDPLNLVGHYGRRDDQPEPFTVVQAEINGRRPLACRIVWANSGGNLAHFVALGGWSVAADGSTYVNVCDPLYGTVQKKYEDFVSAYMTSGDRWQNSYFTVAAMAVAGGGAAPDLNSPTS